ncbi:MAG: hypothetical protein ACK42D_03205 [Candidatus Paceibacteria bacterium]
MEILSSIVIALAATVFVVLGSIAGEVTKKTVLIISVLSFVIFFIISYVFRLSELVLSLL